MKAKIKTKTYPDQLLLEFEIAIEAFNTSAKAVNDAAGKLTNASVFMSPEKSAEVAKTAKKAAYETAVLRDRLNRLVKLLARRKNLHWREIWRIVYSRVREKTGFDAEARGIAAGSRPIEALEKHGFLSEAIEVALHV